MHPEPSPRPSSQESEGGLSLRNSLRAHKGVIRKLLWSRDGQRLASAADDRSVRVWDPVSGTQLRELTHPDRVASIAWSDDGRLIASGGQDRRIRIWNSHTGDEHSIFVGHNGPVRSIAFDPIGKYLASAGTDETIRLWDLVTGNVQEEWHGEYLLHNSISFSPDGMYLAVARQGGATDLLPVRAGGGAKTLKLHTGDVFDSAWSADASMLITASQDRTIRVYDLANELEKRVLEGHTSDVLALWLSDGGNILCSIEVGQLWLWSCVTWETLAIFKDPLGSWRQIAVPDSLNAVATLTDGESAIDVWDLRLTDDVLRRMRPRPSIRYTSAKIALVGESGAGKTGLGWRLAHGTYKDHPSTHGQQFWLIDSLGITRDDGTECQAVLWDLAGQPDYRLIHAIFLDDVDLGLIVFDPTSRQDPLRGVEYWIRQLARTRGGAARTILVGARVDRGGPTLSSEELNEFCKLHGIQGGYLSTSALTGEGLSELLKRMRSQIGWEQMTLTVTTNVFKTIKDVVLRIIAGAHLQREDLNPDVTHLLISPAELHIRILAENPGLDFTDEQMMTAVGHLAKHGYVTLLRKSSQQQAILLTPSRLNNLAASFVVEARRDPKGLGVLDEARVLAGDYPFQELADLSIEEKQTMLDATATIFLRSNICFRETLGTSSLLVFPALINLKRSVLAQAEIIEDVSYTVTGAVENVYAALVVLLGYTNTFTRTNQWQNQAQYELAEGEICGFRLLDEREGEIELGLYYGRATPRHVRMLFQGAFEKFLRTRDVTVTAYPRVVCSQCSEVQNRNMVVKRLQEEKTFLFCSECGGRIELVSVAEPIILSGSDRERLESERVRAGLKTAFEASLVSLKRLLADKKPPTCFVSYAWGTLAHERWVRRLAGDLRNAGISVVLDKRDTAIGTSIARFISGIADSEYVAVVGTTSYLEKYENRISVYGSVVAAEVDLINQRLTGTELQKACILPLLLEGTEQTALPPLLRGRLYADFRNDALYYPTLLDLVLQLNDLGEDGSPIADLRESVRNQALRLIA
jgi:small GTP-binding protein